MSPVTLTITDETTSGAITNQIKVRFSDNLTTVKAIIETRVTAEVENYNQRLPEYYTGLVQPGNAERTLNGFKLKEKKQVDAEKQCLVALDAFQKNGYFILIDNIQATDLDQMIVVNENTTISFLKLTQLVGG
jgi:hypothetical protein